jgi:outer membrane murein-binding lipoprotein Lpp
MKNKIVTIFLTTVLVSGSILTQGCADSSKSEELNQKIKGLSQKIDALSTKVEALQKQAEANRQAELQTALQAQQDAIVSRVSDFSHYLTTNLLTKVNDNTYSLDLTLEKEFNGKLDDIEKEIKPLYHFDGESIGDKVGKIKQDVDQIQRSVNQIKIDNLLINDDVQKIKRKLGIIF